MDDDECIQKIKSSKDVYFGRYGGSLNRHR
jgi:hypothetical protein